MASFTASVALAGLAACALSSRSASQVPPADSLQTLLKTTTFAFQGTVLARGAVADPVLTPSNRTLVVRVSSVLQCPSEIGDFSGQTVTVHMPSDSVPRNGASAWFFAMAWVVGDRIAVDAPAAFVDLTAAQSTQLALSFDKAVWLNYMSLFTARISEASLVATATVTGIAPVQRRTNREGEHITPWSAVTVHVDSVLRGSPRLAGQPTQILVPTGLVLGNAAAALASVLLGATEPAPTGLAPGFRRLFVAENANQNPDFPNLISQAPFFARDSLGVRPLSEVANLTALRTTALPLISRGGRCNAKR